MIRGVVLLLLIPVVLAVGPSDQPRQTRFRDFHKDGTPCNYCPEMTTLPGGRFRMGATPGEGHSDERGAEGEPIPVSIPAGLAFSVSEITRREFAAYSAAKPQSQRHDTCSGLRGDRFVRDVGGDWRNPGFPQTGKHPVVCVSWKRAKDYAAWLSERTGQEYRLPTEAEWEYAARAESAYRFWWGDAMLPGRVNCLHEWCDTLYPYTAETRSFRSNPFGLHDMLGNVWEWVEDCYRTDAYRHHRRYPLPVPGPMDCHRVIRGGSWAENYWSLRVSNREGWKADVPLNDIGFRVVRVGRIVPL